jgi:uncharacterized membrane protein
VTGVPDPGAHPDRGSAPPSRRLGPPSWRRPTEPESRRPVFVAAAVIIAGQAWVSRSLGVDPFWAFPVASAILLAGSIAVYEGREEPGKLPRLLSFLAIAVLIGANAVSLVLLVRGVFVGSSLAAPSLLFTGLALWLDNVAIFALLYWEMDGGGPEARAAGYTGRYPDFVFPQHQDDQDQLSPDEWKPAFYDYLYVSLTSSIAFSPTDAMPYTRRAKLLMAAENLLSFATLAVIVARAVNIARG